MNMAPYQQQEEEARSKQRLGKEAVRPLVEALAATDPSLREVICRALGRIGYAHAAPYLKELAERKQLLGRTAIH